MEMRFGIGRGFLRLRGSRTEGREREHNHALTTSKTPPSKLIKFPISQPFLK